MPVRLSRSMLSVMALAAVVSLAAGCKDSPTSPTESPAFSHTDIRLGTGAEVVTGSIATVNYTGWLYNSAQPEQKGAQFDTSIGREPFAFTVGAGNVISGWDKGLLGMKVGGVRRLVIPPSMGYGSTRVGTIPPNSTLLFDVELISVQ